ncbi:MAG: hypothetical protein IT318_12920 [Anaerolineales bacterium]|nr:hypothetical protein [Anaerolineales bacterium]
MSLFINHHSFVLLTLGLWLGLALVVWRAPARARGRGLLALGVMGATLVGLWLALRTGTGGQTETAQVDAQLGQGRPVLVELYSDY